ncbi:MAG: methyltransferase domain-containing protein [Verrucomicrobia bacterium]|nr:methyltransferase domain-containing protein [Verrucomicrobiota bacterium]
MSQATTSKTQFMLYRLSTIFKSLKTLYTLPQEKVDAFVKSYGIYDFDWADENELISKMGKDYYQEIKKGLVDWYSVLNHLCAIGQVEKMYIPPAIDLSVSIIENQKLIEKRMSQDLRLKKGSKVLDIGCGRGRVAANMSSMTGAEVTGINLDPDQLASAKMFASVKGLPCNFRQGDVNDIPLPFADNSLDAVYQIQVFSLSRDLEKLFRDIHRVLKPGGRLACLDWMSLDAYNPKDPHHASLMRRIKPLIGAIGTHSVAEYVEKLERAGFDVVVNENPSIDGMQAPLIDRADKFFTRVTKLVKFLVKCRLMPKHFIALFDRLTQDGQALVEADRMKLVTTTYYIVAEKKR